MIKPKLIHLVRILGTLIWFWLYIPHLICFFLTPSVWGGVKEDVHFKTGVRNSLIFPFILIYCLHTSSFFRTVFYHRIGEKFKLLIGWYRPGDKYFLIYPQTKIAPGFGYWHPYATIIRAHSIGANFRCMQCTTIGSKGSKGEFQPTIGNNVILGANVTIIGDVKVGNNVSIGAGSVVVKDIPDNCIAAGNPAKVIKYL